MAEQGVADDPRTELRRLAELLIWARENVTERWDGAPDYQPGSIHEKWVEACSPQTILALLDDAEG